MSILDTFFLMFEGDASGAKKASEETEKASEKTAHEVAKHGEQMKHSAHEVEEENSRLAESFDQVREHAHEMTERLIEHALEVAAAFKALFEVEKLVENFFEQAEKSDQLGETARQIGVNVEQLDAWGQAVRRVGGTAEGFEGSLKAIEFRMQRIALAAAEGKKGGDRSSRFFKALGIDPSEAQDIFKLLEEIPKKIENMPKQQSNALLRGIGFDDGTIRLLQAGGKEVEELIEKQKRLGSITMEDAETAERFNREWMDVKELFRNITVAADTEFLPALQSLLESVEAFVEFLRDHAELVKGFFIGLATAAIIAGEAFGVLGAILGFVFSPVVLITGAVLGLIAAFAFLYDDIIAFGEGNNSVIGELAKRWPIVGEVVMDLIEVFKWLWATIKEGASDIIGWVERIPEGFEQWKEIIGSVIEWIKATFETLPEPIKAVFEDIFELGKTAFGALPAEFKLAFDFIKADVAALYEVFKAVFHLIADLVVEPQNAFSTFIKSMSDAWDNFVGKIPNLAKEFSAVVDALKEGADHAAQIFLDLWNKIGWIFAKLGSVGSTVSGWISKTAAGTPEPFDTLTGKAPASGSATAAQHPFVGNPDDIEAMVAARAALASTQSPLMAQTPQSLAGAGGSTVENHINANVGTITITTAATDPEAVRKDLADHLADHYKGVLTTYADGVTH